jgi:hypothetical protein
MTLTRLTWRHSLPIRMSLASLGLMGWFSPFGIAAAHTDQPSSRSIRKILDTQVQKGAAPGIIAAVIDREGSGWVVASGERKADSGVLLAPEFMNKLISPAGFYAGGWGVLSTGWTRGSALTHNGTNGIWYATVTVAPGIGRAFVIVTNSQDFKNTGKMCAELMNQLITLELKALKSLP